jgi:hydrogenase nickel incorporation protein HypA/HybF
MRLVRSGRLIVHEFSLCEAMVRTLIEEYERNVEAGSPPRVKTVRVVVGAMHQLVAESFHMAYEALTADSPLAGSALVLEKIEVEGRCRECGWEGPLTMPFFVCGGCGRSGLDITAGREFYIKDMELEDL